MTIVLERPNTLAQRHRPGAHTYLDTSVAEIETSLAGIRYPADKQDLIRWGKFNCASDDVTAFLSLLPPGEYRQFHDIASMAWAWLLV